MLDKYQSPAQSSLQWDSFLFMQHQPATFSLILSFNLMLFNSLSLPGLYSFVLLFQRNWSGFLLSCSPPPLLRANYIFSHQVFNTAAFSNRSIFYKVQNLMKINGRNHSVFLRNLGKLECYCAATLCNQAFRLALKYSKALKPRSIQEHWLQIAPLIFLPESTLERNYKLLYKTWKLHSWQFWFLF